MSDAMRAVGYPAELIRKEQARESTSLRHPDFPYSIYRSMEGPGDGKIELAIQVLHYKAPGDNGSLDHRDPNYEAGHVEFGDAINVATGRTIELTRLELELAEEAFWKQ